MAQKKAYVRYAQNKAVPGSLIVRTKAPKVGTWKEVPYDICCGGGDCTPVPIPTIFENVEQLPVAIGIRFFFLVENIPCAGFDIYSSLMFSLDITGIVSNAQDAVDLINSDPICQENGIIATLNTSDPELTPINISLSKCKCLYTTFKDNFSYVSVNPVVPV
jgi:hypothetical protein